MGDNIEFETDTYGGMEGSEAIAQQQSTANSALLNGAPCSNGDCTNTSNPAEEAWVKLVSAIPVAGQVESFKCVAGGTAAPSPEEVQSLVYQIRPTDGDKYALRTLADKWFNFNYDFSENPDSAVAPILDTKLGHLSDGWQGDDFDAFAEQMETVFSNCERIAADIGNDSSGMIGLLKQKADEIYALQGGDSHELPYPAPQYWTEDEGSLFSNPKVHVRAPFTDGDCKVAEGCMYGDGDAEEAMELGGFDGEYANELNQYKTDQTEYHFERLKAENPEATEAELAQLHTQAEQLAEQDANDRAATDYEEADQDYEARAAEQNETVMARWTDAEVSTSEFTPTAEPSEDTTFRESGDDLTDNGYSPPGGGDFNGSPTSSGIDGLNPPESTSSFGGGSGGFGGGGGGSLGDYGTDGSGTGLDSDNPWSSYAGEDPDDISGGLASGPGAGLGGSLGGGSGLPTGAGGGIGAGPGGAGLGAGGGLIGGAGGGRGGGGMGAGGRAGGLSGKAAAGAGGKSGRMGSGMMGGGRGGTGSSEDNEGRETWLTEDDDVWGIGNEDSDPYA
ncbi:hypothetical protein [Glycomyces arizonensis]|uniref:hypothetical protein n=1 Tax=Glycomyces arizonensis TaxID=256035 RepID=UPI0003F73E10|nr:hypothetical protein [Glycomyces arizonensis]